MAVSRSVKLVRIGWLRAARLSVQQPRELARDASSPAVIRTGKLLGQGSGKIHGLCMLLSVMNTRASHHSPDGTTTACDPGRD